MRYDWWNYLRQEEVHPHKEECTKISSSTNSNSTTKISSTQWLLLLWVISCFLMFFVDWITSSWGGKRWLVSSFTMKILAWNCRGLAKAATVIILRSLVRSHHPSILFLLELKISSSLRISQILKSVGFSNFHSFMSTGLAGGIAICWTASINHNAIISTHFLIKYYFSKFLYSILAVYKGLLSSQLLIKINFFSWNLEDRSGYYWPVGHNERFQLHHQTIWKTGGKPFLF